MKSGVTDAIFLPGYSVHQRSRGIANYKVYSVSWHAVIILYFVTYPTMPSSQRRWLSVAITAACLPSCWSIMHEKASGLPSKEFDFIIVGGERLIRCCVMGETRLTTVTQAERRGMCLRIGCQRTRTSRCCCWKRAYRECCRCSSWSLPWSRLCASLVLEDMLS